MNKRIFFAALVFLTACSANPHKRVPRDAANAICGSPATLTAVTTMTIEGRGAGLTSFKRTISFPNERWKQVEMRIPEPGVPHIVALDGTLAFDVDASGVPTRASDGETRLRRAQFFHNPIGYLEAVFADAGSMSNTRTEGAMEAVDMTIEGDVYSLFIDSATKLPAKIVSNIQTSNGASQLETSFADYTTAYGYKLPSKITTKLNDQVVSDLIVEQQFFGGAIGDLSAPGVLTPAGAPDHRVTLGAQPFDQPGK